LADFHSFIEELSKKIIEVDDTIPELPLKDIVRVSVKRTGYGILSTLTASRCSRSTEMFDLARTRLHTRSVTFVFLLRHEASPYVYGETRLTHQQTNFSAAW
jgi:hypothetical protein